MHSTFAAAEAAHAGGFAIDQAVHGDFRGLGTCLDCIGGAVFNSGCRDDYGRILLGRGPGSKDIAVSIEKLYLAGHHRGSLYLDRTLSGVASEVFIHAGCACRNDYTAVDGCGNAGIDGAVSCVGGAGNVDGAAVYNQVAVTVKAVTACVHGRRPAVEVHSRVFIGIHHSAAHTAAEALAIRSFRGAAAGCIETVVGGNYIDGAVHYVDDFTFDAFVAVRDIDSTAVNPDLGVGVNAVICCVDGDVAVLNIDPALRVVFVISTVDAVTTVFRRLKV